MRFDPPDEEAIRFAAKAALRKRLGNVRRALPREAARKRDQRIHARCLELMRQGPVASYLPMRGEIDTAPLHDTWLKQGLQVAVPTIEPEHEDSLRWREFGPDTALVRHVLGFEMPTADAPRVLDEAICAVLVPCLAVDEQGNRLGWGGGFYDRALPALRNAKRIAIAYDFQLLAELPATAMDQPVDWVITDSRTIEVRR